MGSKEKILVVDDEPDMLNSCRRAVVRMGHPVLTALNGEEALRLFREEKPDLVLTDLKMPGKDGLDVLRTIRQERPETMVILFTGYGTIQTAVEAMKEGAFDFVTKPFYPDQLRVSVEKALSHKQLVEENRNLQGQLASTFRFENIVGRSPVMQRVLDAVRKIADTPMNVLVLGESGTGKELIARSIHANSARRTKPFVALNCAALPEALIESELFGHERGAFTGAVTSKPGLLEFASGGTFFFDEICEFPPSLQVKLLRMLEEREIRRVGGTKMIDIDVRVISATNRDVEVAVQQGDLREDLYYRLNTFVIHLPPLRERREDLPLLAHHFLEQFVKTTQKSIEGFEEETMEILKRQPWRGNVRELQNAVERAVSITSARFIRPSDLPESVFAESSALMDVSQLQLPLKEAKASLVEEFERKYLLYLLETYEGNVSRSAEAAGVERRSLHRLLLKYGIHADAFRT